MDYRYFRVTDDPLPGAFEYHLQQKAIAYDQLKAIGEEFGASWPHQYLDGTFAGFGKVEDKELWKKSKQGLYLPKKNSKKGKSICARIEASKLPNYYDVLDCLNLPGVMFVAFDGERAYSVTFAMRAGVFFVKVPWKGDGSFFEEHFKPHPSMKEIKEWEYLKEWDELETQQTRQAGSE